MEFWHNQELTHLCDFVEEVNRGTNFGLRFQITTEQLRLEQGFQGRFTDVPFEDMGPLTTDSRIKTLWASCQEFDISIEDPFGSLDPVREGDVMLMPVFLKQYKNPAKRKLLQECRMFLGAVSLADLCTMRGDRIWAPIYHGTERCQSVRTIQWPRQPRQLSSEHWRVWKLALDACFTQFASKDHILRKPLGCWLKNPERWPI